MAAQDEPAVVKNRWTRWWMWFLYGSLGFLLLAIIAALIPDNSTPEERMAQLEATQTAESVKAAREASEEQTKEAEERFMEQTKTAEELSKQQTKEAEDNPEPDAGYCAEIAGWGRTVGTMSLEIHETFDLIEKEQVDESTGVRLLAYLETMAEASTKVKDIDAPKAAKKLHRKVEDLADVYLEVSDDIPRQLRSGDAEAVVRTYLKFSETSSDYKDVLEEAADYCEWQ